MARAGFRDWLHDALSKGAGPAHALTKDPAPLVDLTVLDDDGLPTADPVAAVDAKAAKWGALWTGQSKREAAQMLAELRSELAEGSVAFTAEDLQRARRSYSDRKAKGIDGWAPGELKRLPLQVLKHFAVVLSSALQQGVWPTTLMCNVMAMLGKPQGGERCVAKSPLLYRAVCRIRKPVVAEWEKQAAHHRDTAVRGSSAAVAASSRLLQASYVAGHHF